MQPMTESSDNDVPALVNQYKAKFDNYPQPQALQDFAPPFPVGFAAKYQATELLKTRMRESINTGEPVDFERFASEVLKRYARA
jgi:hypothetical protein